MPNSNAIIVSKENEVYLKLDAEASARKMLSEFFSFEVPGYKFTPQYRSRVWDGRIRLFQYASGRIYVGLLPYIQEFAKQNDLTLVYDKGVKEKINDIPVIIQSILNNQKYRIGFAKTAKFKCVNINLLIFDEDLRFLNPFSNNKGKLIGLHQA